jgi:putative glutathione S-transferase
VFEALDKIEGRLSTRRYLTGDRFTEADIRLFTTLIRFDPVYHGHFKCNLHRVIDYPNLWGFVRDVYQMPGVSDTVHIDFIKRHYYFSHANLNPSRIVPIGPELNYDTPHGRERLVH